MTETNEKEKIIEFVRICQRKNCLKEATHYIGKWVCDYHFNKHYDNLFETYIDLIKEKE